MHLKMHFRKIQFRKMHLKIHFKNAFLNAF
jgi:hypothetical protein